MMKYEPLAQHLARQTGDEWRATFADLEKVLGFPLPKIAHTSGAWWANEGLKPHNLTWIDQGWKVADLDRKGQSVVFRRAPRPSPSKAVALGPAEPPVVDNNAKFRLSGAALIGASVALMAGLGAVALRLVKKRGA